LHQHLAVIGDHSGDQRHADNEVIAILAIAVIGASAFSFACHEALITLLKCVQVSNIGVTLEVNVSAIATDTTVGFAVEAEGNVSVPSISCFDCDSNFIYEHNYYSIFLYTFISFVIKRNEASLRRNGYAKASKENYQGNPRSFAVTSRVPGSTLLFPPACHSTCAAGRLDLIISIILQLLAAQCSEQ
jgi:hypothetical protein